jgi:hypothetical protein
VVHVEKKRNWGNLKDKDHLEDVDLDGRII